MVIVIKITSTSIPIIDTVIVIVIVISMDGYSNYGKYRIVTMVMVRMVNSSRYVYGNSNYIVIATINR